MRKSLLALVVAMGCGGGEDVTRTTLAGVMTVDVATLETNRWYIDTAASDAPVLASELEDREGAVEVRLLATRAFVAAVSQSSAEGAWPVVNTFAGETNPGGKETGTTVPTGNGGSINVGGDVNNNEIVDAHLVEVNWDAPFQLSEAELEQLQAIHPGCI